MSNTVDGRPSINVGGAILGFKFGGITRSLECKSSHSDHKSCISEVSRTKSAMYGKWQSRTFNLFLERGGFRGCNSAIQIISRILILGLDITGSNEMKEMLGAQVFPRQQPSNASAMGGGGGNDIFITIY